MIKSDLGKLSLSGSSDIIITEFVHIIFGIRDSFSEHDMDKEEITRILTAAFFAGMTHDNIEDVLKNGDN